MVGSFVLQSNAPSPIDAALGMPIDAAGRFVPAPSERQSFLAPSSIPDELPVSVQVSGTTFLGVYGIVGDVIELMSPDFGEAVTAIGAEPPHSVAEQLLRTLAGQEIARSEIPFMQDHRSGAGF